VHGRRGPTTLEGREARIRRKEIEEEERRKREKKFRRRLRELDRIYSLYLTCLPPGFDWSVHIVVSGSGLLFRTDRDGKGLTLRPGFPARPPLGFL
jgi:hypothetical protein